MKTRHHLFTIVPGKEEKLRAWLKTLQTERREEAQATLPFEHCLLEKIFLFEFNGVTYALSVADHREDLIPMDPTVAINQEHRAIIQECLVSSDVPVDLALSLESPELA